MIKNIGDTTSNELTVIFEDHKKFAIFISYIASMAISETSWSRVKALLSPLNNFAILDSVAMPAALFSGITIKLNNFILYEKRMKLFVDYEFPDNENAAGFEFLLRGASVNVKQVMDIESMTHSIMLGVDNSNKVFGVITILESDGGADTLYTRARKTLEVLKNTH